MGRQRPRSVTNAIRVQAALVVVSALGTAMVVVLREDLVREWAQSQGGLDAVRQSQLDAPAFVPVAVVSFIVYALLVWVIGSLFGKGHGWARYALGATAVSFVFTMLVIYRADPPVAAARPRRGRRRPQRRPAVAARQPRHRGVHPGCPPRRGARALGLTAG